MRAFWIVVAAVVGVLALATVASASMRDEVRSLVDVVASGLPEPDASGSPIPQPSASATEQSAPEEGVVPPENEGEAEVQGPAESATHGALVSQVARDRDAVASRTLPNGKTITNHGMAVSAAAHDTMVNGQKAKRDRAGKAAQGHKAKAKAKAAR
jgi:hypothetical protein